MSNTIYELGRFLSLILRHKPEKINITLDEEGWALAPDLVSKLRKMDRFKDITFHDLDEVVRTNNKKRFEYKHNKMFIRACQGHSIGINLNLSPMSPPMYLYHGTISDHYENIFSKGLVKQSRDHVHMSSDIGTAENVGLRYAKHKDKLMILIVSAKEMEQDGYTFYRSTNGVWLTDHVPSKYLREHK